MSEMVERVARAIAKRRYEKDNLVGITESAIGRELYVNKRWTDFEEDARAAIEAMREPTEAAVLAGAEAGVDQIYYKSDSWNRCVDDEFKPDHLNYARFCWRAMIDAALASPDLV